MYHIQFTNSVKSRISDGDKLYSLKISDDKKPYQDLSNTLKRLSISGEILSNEDKIELANYMLDHFVDWNSIADGFLETLKHLVDSNT